MEFLDSLPTFPFRVPCDARSLTRELFTGDIYFRYRKTSGKLSALNIGVMSLVAVGGTPHISVTGSVIRDSTHMT